jgi:hypothetical protein
LPKNIFQMGNGVCYNSEAMYFQTILNQKDLIEVLKLEQTEIVKNIEKVNKTRRRYLEGEYCRKVFSLHVKDIQLFLEKIEGNFYLVSLLGSLKAIEKRLKEEKYQYFDLIKQEFISFYKKVRDAYDFDFLLTQEKSFNLFLDKNLISPKFIPIIETEF